MKKTFFSLFLFAALSSYSQNKHVLFLGNSYTAVNNLPDLVAQLALAGGDTLIYDSNTPGGYTLQLHSQDVQSLNKIAQQPWDYVVVQAQSQEPSLDSLYVAQNVFPYGHILDSLIHRSTPCAQTLFFMTWGRKNGDASNCVAYPPVCTYAGMQAELRARYLQMAYDNGTAVAPAGVAWQQVIAQNPIFDLYMSDESHPSLYGSYLTACVFYASIYQRSPIGLSYTAGLPSADVLLMQTVASDLVLDSLSVWNTNVYRPQPSFSAVISGNNTVTVTSTTPNATQLFWNDGVNGFVAGNTTQTFTYNTAPPYTICLAASNACFSDTICEIVDVLDVQSSDALASVQIFPNPAQDAVMVRWPAHKPNATFTLTDMQGRVLRTIQMRDDEISVDLSGIAAGSYILIFNDSKTNGTRPLVVLDASGQ
jgi:Secretion system C-terminal sorting domain